MSTLCRFGWLADSTGQRIVRSREGHAPLLGRLVHNLGTRESAGDQVFYRERVTGIEPAFSAWEADVLPLNYTREVKGDGSKRLSRAEWSAAGDALEPHLVPGGAQHVARAAHRVDHARAPSLELPAQRAHVHLDDVDVVVLEAPHVVEQLDLREHLASVAHERGEE